MDVYKYTRCAFKDGQRHEEACSITGDDLICTMGQNNQLAFFSLINKWNRTGLMGVANGGPIYVFVAEG